MSGRNATKATRDHARDNYFGFDIARSPVVALDTGDGLDEVSILSRDNVRQVRLTFTSSEVGNGNPLDSGTLAGQDGGLAVRVQAEDASGNLFGPVSRFDDEGIIFSTRGRATFDVRDLVSGAQRGDQFDVVFLGTDGADVLDVSRSNEAYYMNGGRGDDRLTGGRDNDFLVGGASNDTLNGNAGNDSFIGGGGNDLIIGGIGDDLAIFNVQLDGSDITNLGRGDDTVSIAAPAGSQIRLTFTSSEVGNGSAADSGALANQDGGLAVRLQLEGADGSLVGMVSRVDDEGTTFSTTGDATFDVRDLVSGTARGNQFDVVVLGTNSNNSFDESGEAEAYYINAGQGDDRLVGGLAADFLVGGAGNDRLDGRENNDSHIGGGGADVFIFSGLPGDDRILDFVSGTDKIDFSDYGITAADVSSSASGSNTILSVDSNQDGAVDFQVTLVGVGVPAMGDYIF